MTKPTYNPKDYDLFIGGVKVVTRESLLHDVQRVVDLVNGATKPKKRGMRTTEELLEEIDRQKITEVTE